MLDDAYGEQAYMYINPKLAAEKGIAENELFEVSSINGRTSRFMAKITDKRNRKSSYMINSSYRD